MILFVFEGNKREPDIFKTIEYLHFPKGQTIVCSFGNNIYELYRELCELDGAGDIVSLLRELYAGKDDSPFAPDVKSSDFSEIFLFFDYDFQNKNLTLDQMNERLTRMLEMFSDETDAGKLYINYPMIEALRYTRQLPDADFTSYVISRQDCREKDFKDLAGQFSAYGSLDFIVLDFRKEPSTKTIEKVKRNWTLLQIQHTAKANYLCTGDLAIPANKEVITQLRIFEAQLDKHILPSDSVAILSAFPIFLFEYFR